MKSILYVGATLMIGASIYGFVDYKQTSKKNEFKKMYREETVSEPEVVTVTEINKMVLPSEAITKEKTTQPKKKSLKKDKPQEEIISIKLIADPDVLITADPVTIEKAEVDIAPTKENVTIRKVKNRKFNSKLFSRAPLREEYIEVKLPDPAKTDVKKTEVKIKEK